MIAALISSLVSNRSPKTLLSMDMAPDTSGVFLPPPAAAILSASALAFAAASEVIACCGVRLTMGLPLASKIVPLGPVLILVDPGPFFLGPVENPRELKAASRAASACALVVLIRVALSASAAASTLSIFICFSCAFAKSAEDVVRFALACLPISSYFATCSAVAAFLIPVSAVARSLFAFSIASSAVCLSLAT